MQYLRVLGSAITAPGLAATQSSGGEKIVSCIVYFSCSLLLLVVVVFPLLSY